MIDKSSKKIVHIGISGFPFGSAALNRCSTIYSELVKKGFRVLFINSRAFGKAIIDEELSRKGCINGIDYIYTTPTPYKSKKFILRRWYNFIGPLKEFILIMKLLVTNQMDLLLYYPTGNFFKYFIYSVIVSSFRIPIICHYVEFRSSFSERSSYLMKINDYFFDNYFMNLCDGVIPISEFLLEKVKEKNDNLLQFKLPPVISFSKFSQVQKIESSNKYFLYVGSVGYKNSIRMICDTFNLIDNEAFHLILVLHGGSMTFAHDIVASSHKRKMIKVMTNLSFEDLIKLYKGASALLIPLSDSIRDKARFPQKISEYLASSNPIITTNYGECKNYFKDKKNALVSDDNKIESFSEKLNFVINNPQESKIIGYNGYLTGEKYFNIDNYGDELTNFLEELIDHKK